MPKTDLSILSNFPAMLLAKMIPYPKLMLAVGQHSFSVTKTIVDRYSVKVQTFRSVFSMFPYFQLLVDSVVHPFCLLS